MPKEYVNGIEMYYEIHGKGPKLVYISGTGGDLRNKPNIFDTPLAQHFTILAFDQRGMGQNSKPDIPYSMADYADDAVTLMKSQGWPSALMMGVSFGGMVAQEIGLRYPAHVKKLVLACTSSGGKGGASYPLHELSKLPIEERVNKIIELLDTRCNEEWKNTNPEKYRETYDTWEKYYTRGGDDPETEVGSRRQLIARMSHNTYDRLHNLTMPVYICGGKYDGIAPPQNQRNLNEKIPGSEMELFEGGHIFLRQDPRAYENIIEFLKN
jgi:3-oxoadipate enol-lactonase